jgi:hypothetical protein
MYYVKANLFSEFFVGYKTNDYLRQPGDNPVCGTPSCYVP